MGLDLRIDGSAELHRLAEQIRASGDKGLGRQMARALKQATEPIEREIRQEYKTLPTGGGYAEVFSKSLRFRTQQRTGARTASYVLKTYADGTKERRDIERLESGQLRHPVYGRSRPSRRRGERHGNPWAVTRVRGNFHKRGTDGAADEAEKQLSKVLTEFANKLLE